MMRKISLVFALAFISSCYNRIKEPPIGDNLSFPSSIVSLSDGSGFLLLNSNAANIYSDGNIQLYQVDSQSLNKNLIKSESVESHGSDLALSGDQSLIALSYDSGHEDTYIDFISLDKALGSFVKHPELRLNLANAGGKQSIKRLNFFKLSQLSNSYYLTGEILSYVKDNGAGSGIPSRVFLAEISPDLTSSKVHFYLSYNIGDPNALSQKSDSLRKNYNNVQYAFGSTAPTFDSKHNLLIAFPTGAVLGLNSRGENSFPRPPSDVLGYLEGHKNANLNCDSSEPASCDSEQPDLRTSSLMVVDLQSFLLNGKTLDLSTFFVPLTINSDGLSYAQKTNGGFADSRFPEFAKFEYLRKFSASVALNLNGCNTSSSQTDSANLFDSQKNSENMILAIKNPSGAVGNTSVFQFSGLDILKKNIDLIQSKNVYSLNDFKYLSNTHILDKFNTYYDDISKDWLEFFDKPGDEKKKAGPIFIAPYSFVGSSGAEKLFTTTSKFSFARLSKDNEHRCLPVWVRNTYSGLGNYGMDSSWLYGQFAPYKEPNNTYPLKSEDPSSSSYASFPWASGARVCTALTQTDAVYCFNFLTGEDSRFKVSLENGLKFIHH